jgi:hypothetical protein
MKIYANINKHKWLIAALSHIPGINISHPNTLEPITHPNTNNGSVFSGPCRAGVLIPQKQAK